MTLQATPLRRIFARFFPKRAVSQAMPKEALEADFWPENQKKELALRYLAQGEMSLLQGNLSALAYFEAASKLDPENPDIWYRQGLAFFEYGSEEGQEKTLLVACKNFKISTQLHPSFFECWVAWGNALLQLGRFHEEHHYLLEAKEKYNQALQFAHNQPQALLAELYWDYGIVWSEIAQHSGEALDIKLAIDAFIEAEKHLTNPPPEFYNDFGKAYLEMGLLINDSRFYQQSIQYLQKAVEIAPQYFDGWVSLAESLSQLYINTLDDRYVTQASESFSIASKLDPADPEIWLSWGQLLGEQGKHKKDARLLRLSIEKCARAAQLDEEDPLILSQWIESLSMLGLITSRLDLLTEAETRATKAVEEFPDDPDLWRSFGLCSFALAQYYDDGDHYETAIEKLQFGLSLDRSDAELWHTLGIVHKHYADFADHHDLIDRAQRFLLRALDLKPACPSLLFDAACTLLQCSEQLDSQSHLEHAIYLFETLLQNHQEVLIHHPEWLFQYGKAIEWLADFTEEEAHYLRAAEIFSHILLIDPDFPDIHSHLALCYLHSGHLSGSSELYHKAIHSFRLAARQDAENDQVWLDWGFCLINLAHFTLDTTLMYQLYMDAELKLTEAGRLGNQGAHYALACLYSILGRLSESMEFIYKALHARALPMDELLSDDWLDNVRATPAFAQFLSALETKLQQTREE